MNVRILVPLLYLLVGTTDILNFWQNSGFSQDEIDYTKGTIIISFLGNILLSIACISLLKNRTLTKKAMIKDIAIIIVFLYLFTSCFWSPFFFVSIRKFIKLIGLYIMLLYNQVGVKEPRDNLNKMMAYYFIIAAISSLFLIIIFPQWGYMPYDGSVLPKGIFGHKNQFGAFAAFFFLWFLYGKPRYKNLFLVLCFLILIISRASGALISLCITIFISSLILFIFSKKFNINNNLKITILWICTACLCAYFLIIGFNLDPTSYILTLFNKDISLTGRVDLWPILFSYGLGHHPILGSGYESFFLESNVAWITRSLGWVALNAHNGLLHIFLNNGIIGVVLISWLLFRTMVSNLVNKDYRNIYILIFFILCNISEATLFRAYFIFFTFLITCRRCKYESI